MVSLDLVAFRTKRENWEDVAVTDGPNDAAVRFVAQVSSPRIRLIETEQRLGRWGHPTGSVGLMLAAANFIGMSNDDNYYVPGYLEQMLNALDGADMLRAEVYITTRLGVWFKPEWISVAGSPEPLCFGKCHGAARIPPAIRTTFVR
jgi:hypothetical protein